MEKENMKTNQQRAITPERQLKKALRKEIRRSTPIKLAAPVYQGRQSVRNVRPTF